VLSQIGAAQQRLQQAVQQQAEQAELEQQLQQARRQQQVYQELANAYGRNGIPALIVENVLPELEAQANQILAPPYPTPACTCNWLPSAPGDAIAHRPSCPP
jgi:exonuclease SbcC